LKEEPVKEIDSFGAVIGIPTVNMPLGIIRSQNQLRLRQKMEQRLYQKVQKVTNANIT
jgi:hypothetical protein